MSMLFISSELRPVACVDDGPDQSGAALETGSSIRRCPQSVFVVTRRNPLTRRAVMTMMRDNLMLLNSAPQIPPLKFRPSNSAPQTPQSSVDLPHLLDRCFLGTGLIDHVIAH